MPSLLLSNLIMGNDKKSLLRNCLTWILRLGVGGVFIFSGFVKAIDPWGTLYKFQEYLSVIGWSIWPNLVLVGVFSLCTFEFLIGIFLFLGSFRRSAPILAAIIMSFMLPLTLWIAIMTPVADCGCFGDAFLLSNWATFWKNVILSAGIIWLICYNLKCSWVVTPALQWLLFIISGVFIVTIELYGYIAQPLIDFREYKVGESLLAEDSQEEESSFLFIYERDGIQIEVSNADSIPSEDEGWRFVDRKEIARQERKNGNGKEKTFRIWDVKGEEDVTEEVIDKEGEELLVLIPDLRIVSPATTWKLNSLYEWAGKNNVEMIGIVAGSEEEISEWEDLSMASYPIYLADDTQIKEVARGNPSIVFLVDGIIEWKSTLAAMNIDDFLSPETSSDARSFGRDNKSILFNCISLYLVCVCVLIFLSFTPKIGNLFFNRKGKITEKE